MNIYIGIVRKDMSYLPILYPHLGIIDRPQRLFFNFAHAFPEKLFDIVDQPEKADYLLIPHDYFSAARHPDYVREYVDLARKTGKTILIFDHSDFDWAIDVPHSIIFRVSVYRSRMKPNEIVMPPIIEDLGAKGISIRKKSAKPIVGFCGWADHHNWKSRLRYWKDVMFTRGPRKPGLYFRRKAIALVRHSSRLVSHIIVRRSYSGHRETIELDEKRARSEYVNNIVSSDYVLSPKGDGNYSNRFYEVMSLGCIPVLIDTDTVLPLENEINYDTLIVRIPSNRMQLLANRISTHYDSLDDDSYKNLQNAIRDVFERKLCSRSFFERVFTDPTSLLRPDAHQSRIKIT